MIDYQTSNGAQVNEQRGTTEGLDEKNNEISLQKAEILKKQPNHPTKKLFNGLLLYLEEKQRVLPDNTPTHEELC